MVFTIVMLNIEVRLRVLFVIVCFITLGSHFIEVNLVVRAEMDVDKLTGIRIKFVLKGQELKKNVLISSVTKNMIVALRRGTTSRKC